jgi:hypothetical protein
MNWYRKAQENIGFIEGGAGALTDLSASGKSGIYRRAVGENSDEVIGFHLQGQIVSAIGTELAKMQEIHTDKTFHELLAMKEDLEPFLDSAERWQYGISHGTLFWWGSPSKSVRRQVHDYLGTKGYRVKQENSYTGIIQNRNMPTILPDASSKSWYKH